MKKLITRLKRFFLKRLYKDHPIKKGCYVGWSQKSLNDKNFWGATNKASVKVRDITYNEGTIFTHVRTIHFETPLEKHSMGETYSAFECWLEHRCKIEK